MMTTMMMGDAARQTPPWTPFDGDCSDAALEALLRYLPSNEAAGYETDSPSPALDAYSSDEFRIYEFKVRRCARGRSHDWTDCPFAHPGEKARRRDPRRHHYSGAACPDFRKGGCRRGDACEFAHGVFECWLHPARYRTQPCKDGVACRRRVCFFAHTPDQLRVVGAYQDSSSSLSPSYDGSPMRRHSLDAYLTKGLLSSSPTSTLVSPPESPPVSPSAMDAVLASMRRLQMGNVKAMQGSWGGALGSPRALGLAFETGFCSLPSTPTRVAAVMRGGGRVEGEERVESGRVLRARMFERLSRESVIEMPDASAPDVGWVSELVQ